MEGLRAKGSALACFPATLAKSPGKFFGLIHSKKLFVQDSFQISRNIISNHQTDHS